MVSVLILTVPVSATEPAKGPAHPFRDTLVAAVHHWECPMHFLS
jgi:hypothetical protein